MLDQLKIWLLIGLAVMLCYFIWDYQYVKAENDRLVSELKSANTVIGALDAIVQRNNEIQLKKDRLIDQIENDAETNDATTAPVLFNAIGRLH